MKHQELRDAIRNLMKENDNKSDAPGWLGGGDYENGLETGRDGALEDINEKLQAILDAHK